MNNISSKKNDFSAFETVTQVTKNYVAQKVNRRNEILRSLDEVRGEIHKSSLLPLFEKGIFENTNIEQVLQKRSTPGKPSFTFAEVHCGRTAIATSYQESFTQGYPVQSSSINLVSSVFNWIENNVSACLTEQETLNLLSPFVQQLKETIDQFEKLKDLEGDELREQIAKFGADTANLLDSLEPDENHTLPVGPPGCGMFLRMVRCEGNEKKFNLFLYNGATDANQQKGVTPSTLPLYVFEAVPASEIYYTRHNGELSSPFLTELTAITVRKVAGATAQRVLTFFEPICAYQVLADKHMVNFIRCMRTNFSSHKSLNALLLHLCGGDRRAYKRMNMDIRLLTLAVEYKRHGNELNKPFFSPVRAQLRIAANNLLKSVYKYAQQNQEGQPILTEQEARMLLGTALGILEGVNKAEETARTSQKAHSEAKVFENDVKTTHANASKAAREFFHPKIDNRESSNDSKFKSFPIAAFDQPEELVNSLEGLKSFLTIFKLELRILGAGQQVSVNKLSLETDGLSAVEQFIAQLPSPIDPYWDKVPKHLIMKCLALLAEINLNYSRAITHSQTKRPSTSVQQLTLFNLYANIHRMAIRWESENEAPVLSYFSLDISRFQEAMELDPMHTIDSFNLLERRRELESYFSGFRCVTVTHCDLFKWSDFSLDPTKAEKELYEMLLKDPEIQEMMQKGDYAQCIDEWAGENASEKGIEEVKRRLLNLDMGSVDLTGYRPSYGSFSQYAQTDYKSELFSVTFKVKKDGFPSYPTYKLNSILHKKFPHIALLKQCSIASAVLFDVNTVDAVTSGGVPTDINGNAFEQYRFKDLKTLSDYPGLASKLMLERVNIAKIDDKHEFELQFYGRKLVNEDFKKKIQPSDRHFTSVGLTEIARKAVQNSIETGMYEVKTPSPEKRQNEILSKIGSLDSKDSNLLLGLQLAEQVASSESRSHNLLQWMRLHPEKLEDPETRARLMILLFRPEYVGNSEERTLSVSILDLLKNDPDHLLVQVRNLVAEGVTRFYHAQPFKRPKVEPLTFLLEIAQIMSRNYLEIHGKKINPPIYEAGLFELLSNLKEGASAFSPEELITLKICQFTHHFPQAFPEQASEKELLDAMLANIRLAEAGIGVVTHLGSRQLSQVQKGCTQLIGEFLRRSSLQKEFSGKFALRLNEELKLPVTLELNKMDANSSPIYSGKDSQGMLWAVNLKTGVILCNGRKVGLSDKAPKQTKLWNHLFQNRTHQYHMANDILNFEDPVYGTMRHLNGEHIQRLYNGVWYTAVAPDSASLNPIVPRPLRSGNSHWISTGGSKVPSVLVCDLQSGQTIYTQNWNGSLLTDSQTTVIRKSVQSHFDRLAGAEWHLGMTNNQNGESASKVFFPQVFSPDGDPVNFQLRDGRWIYNADPSYALADPQMDRMFPHHNQYLLLEKVNRLGYPTGEQRLLMVQPPLSNPDARIVSEAYDSGIYIRLPDADPWQRSKEYLRVRSYQVVDGELRSDTVDGTLYLVWQHLAGKDYMRAMELLRTLGTGDTLTREGSELINAIFKCEENVHDYSPEACAVRLKALWLARTLDPDFKEPTIEIGNRKRSVKDIFTGYLQGLERMPAEVILSGKELADLHDQFKIGPVPTGSTAFESTFNLQRNKAETWKNTRKGIPELPLVLPHPSANYGSNLYSVKSTIESLFFDSRKIASSVPVFGEKEITVHQFYTLYEQLSHPAFSKEERDEIAYRLYHSAAIEVGGFSDDRQFGPTIGRLNILHCLYTDENYIDAPPFPINRNDHEQWLSWINAFKIHLKLDKNANRSSTPPIAQASFVEKTKSKSIKLDEASQIDFIPKKKNLELIELPQRLPEIKIDLVLIKLVEKHFAVEKAEQLQNPLPPLQRLDKLSDMELEHGNAIEQEFQHYNDDVQKAREQVTRLPVFKLKVGQKELIEDMGAFLDPVTGLEPTLLKKENEIITLLMTPRAIRTSGDLVAYARQESPMLRTPRMIDIVRACLKGTHEAYKELNPYLSQQAINEIHQQTLEFMLNTSTLQQVKKTHDFLKKWMSTNQKAKESKIDNERQSLNAEAEAYWQQVIETLTAERAYKCDTWVQIQENVYNLYFEYKTELRIRQIQIDLLRTIMQGQESGLEDLSNIIFQLIMGGGKTSVILSILLDLISEQPNRLATLVLHPSQFDAVLGNVQKFQKDRFNKELVALDYTRQQLNSLTTVKRLYEKIITAQNDRNGIAIKSTLPQVLLLELRKIAADLRDKNITHKDLPTEIERLQVIGKILLLFMDEAVFLTDEVDMVLSIIQVLNFPKGEKQHLPPDRIALTSELFQAIFDLNLMKFGPDAPQIKLEEYFSRFIVPLSEASFEKRKVPQEHKGAYLRYVTGKIQGKLEKYVFKDGKNTKIDHLSKIKQADVQFLRYLWGSEINPIEAGLQALSKFMICTVLPQILTLEPDRHIGYHSSGNGKVIPYQGRKNPATTELANPDEAVAAGALCALTIGIPTKAITELAISMAGSAETHALQYGDFDKTPEAIAFFEMTGISLGLARQGKDIDKIETHLRDNKGHALEFQASLDLIHVTYYNDFLISEAYDIPDLAKANITCTGTPQTKETFERIRNALLESGTEGKILEELRRQGKGRKSEVLPTLGEATANFLDLIKKQDDDHTRTGKNGALIDAGGILKGVTGEQFARSYLNRFKDIAERRSVVFFHRYLDELGEQKGSFAVMRRDPTTGEVDRKPVLIKDTTRESLENVNVDAESMYVFFEESKTTGVDFKLSATCRAFLTFNPLNTTFRKTSQGGLRMRGLWSGQTIDHVIPECHLAYYNNEIPTTDQVLSTSLKNQAIEKSKQITRSYSDRVRHVPKSKAQTQLIRIAAEAKPENFKELQGFVGRDTGYGEYLDTKFSNHLLEQFGRLTTKVNTIEHLGEVAKLEADKFPSVDMNLKNDVLDAHEKLLQQAQMIAKSGYLADNMEAPSHLPGFGTQVEVAAEAQQQQEQQQEQETQVEVAVENQLNFYKQKQNHTEVEEKSWKNLDRLEGELPGKNQGVGFISVYEHLENNKSRYWNGVCYSENFKQNPDELPLYLSENFVGSVKIGETQGSLPIFSPSHKKISHLLVTKGSDGKVRTLALSNHDFIILRNKISSWQKAGLNKPYWIVNLNGELAAGSGNLISEMSYQFGDGIQDDLAYKNALWHANFFNGNLLYLERNPEQTLYIMLQDGERGAKLRRSFLELRIGENTTLRRQLNASDCLNPFNEKLRARASIKGTSQSTRQSKVSGLRNIQPPKISEVKKYKFTAPILSVKPVINTLEELERWFVKNDQTKLNSMQEDYLEIISQKSDQVKSNAKPIIEIKAEEKLEIKQETKLELEVKLEVKLEEIIEVKVDIEPEVKIEDNLLEIPYTRNEVILEEKQETKLEVKLEEIIDVKVDVETEVKLEEKLLELPETRIEVTLEERQETKLEVKLKELIEVKVDIEPEEKLEENILELSQTRTEVSLEEKQETKLEIKSEEKPFELITPKPEKKIIVNTEEDSDRLSAIEDEFSVSSDEEIFQVTSENESIENVAIKLAKKESTSTNSTINNKITVLPKGDPSPIKPSISTARKAGRVVVSILLSIGLSQIFGIVKGLFDLVHRKIVQNSIDSVDAQISEHGPLLDLTNERERLKAQEGVLDVALKADLAALIPLMGIYYYWEILDSGVEEVNS
ncbi:MAG: DUF3638 domain-containing protein [Parachlamydiaceae bacterium]|nr:DUF3638 domain-containing protein [Parachlamydiaceae bacterium]